MLFNGVDPFWKWLRNVSGLDVCNEICAIERLSERLRRLRAFCGLRFYVTGQLHFGLFENLFEWLAFNKVSISFSQSIIIDVSMRNTQLRCINLSQKASNKTIQPIRDIQSSVLHSLCFRHEQKICELLSQNKQQLLREDSNRVIVRNGYKGVHSSCLGPY